MNSLEATEDTILRSGLEVKKAQRLTDYYSNLFKWLMFGKDGRNMNRFLLTSNKQNSLMRNLLSFLLLQLLLQ